MPLKPALLKRLSQNEIQFSKSQPISDGAYTVYFSLPAGIQAQGAWEHTRGKGSVIAVLDRRNIFLIPVLVRMSKGFNYSGLRRMRSQ